MIVIDGNHLILSRYVHSLDTCWLLEFSIRFFFYFSLATVPLSSRVFWGGFHIAKGVLCWGPGLVVSVVPLHSLFRDLQLAISWSLPGNELAPRQIVHGMEEDIQFLFLTLQPGFHCGWELSKNLISLSYTCGATCHSKLDGKSCRDVVVLDFYHDINTSA